MKHTLKKLLAFSLVLALVAGMLVGCGGAPSSSAANSTSASVEATSSAGGKGETRTPDERTSQSVSHSMRTTRMIKSRWPMSP